MPYLCIDRNAHVSLPFVDVLDELGCCLEQRGVRCWLLHDDYINGIHGCHNSSGLLLQDEREKLIKCGPFICFLTSGPNVSMVRSNEVFSSTSALHDAADFTEMELDYKWGCLKCRDAELSASDFQMSMVVQP